MDQEISTATKLSSRKYKTIEELLKAEINSIIKFNGHVKDKKVRNYLADWLWKNYYKDVKRRGNLTYKIEKFNNKSCYYYFINNIFNGYDFLENQETEKILNPDCIDFIQKIHSICPNLNGTFFDYLIRRIISEETEIEFYDMRAEGYQSALQVNNIPADNDYEFNNKTICYSYNISKNTNTYKTENILIEIFITSLCHKLSFGESLIKDKIKDIIKLIENEKNIDKLLYLPLKELVKYLLKDKTDCLLNPCLNGLHADCDVIINNTLYDLKCSKKNDIKELLQLLGYASLINCYKQKFNNKIQHISIINLLKGYIVKYDISHITDNQLKSYLECI